MADYQTWLDDALRVGLAALIGGILGVNRDLHHKPVGLRTLGLVAVAGCVLTLSFSQYAGAHNANAADGASRAAQGLLAGIGFLGAGVIMRSPDAFHVYGMTTAATVLVVAALGVACGLATWPAVAAGSGAAFLLLLFGGSVERMFHGQRRAAGGDDPGSGEGGR